MITPPTFRNFEQSFESAHHAASNAKRAGMVTALSLCTTKEYTTHENITTYIAMARKLGVSFIQFLEPRAVGHYEGKDVKLSMEQKQVLDELFLEINASPLHQQDPIIIHHEFYKSTLGCRGAGNGTFYIDPLGEIHACPFCRRSAGNILTNSIAECINRLRQKGCAVTNTPLLQSMENLEVIEK